MTDSLLRIPGVGPSIAADLHRLGIREVGELRGRNPESLYAELCHEVGHHVDRCVLYVFRCAVYFATEAEHDPELLKWWNWKEGAGGPPDAQKEQAASILPTGESNRRSRSAGS
ncbi:MAG: helix-hairpin-helix domain-containing protein [Bryobacteraceae bacterium]